jgi:hypothetical protein
MLSKSAERAIAELHIRRDCANAQSGNAMAAAAKAERGKTEVRSKGHVKSTVKASKPKKKITPDMPGPPARGGSECFR